LLDDRIGPLPAYARAGEQVVNVLQAHAHLVDEVVGPSRALHPTLDGDLGHVFPTGRDLGRAVVEIGEPDLAHPHRPALPGAVEDDVLHRTAPQGLRALLAHDPLQGVDDVRLAAPVRTDDRRDPVVEARSTNDLKPQISTRRIFIKSGLYDRLFPVATTKRQVSRWSHRDHIY
jgi:hypothetical protein